MENARFPILAKEKKETDTQLKVSKHDYIHKDIYHICR